MRLREAIQKLRALFTWRKGYINKEGENRQELVVNLKLRDNMDWYGLPREQRQEILSCILEKIRDRFPQWNIAINVNVTYSYQNMSLQTNNNLYVIDPSHGWKVYNTHYLGKAEYKNMIGEFQKAIYIDPGY